MFERLLLPLLFVALALVGQRALASELQEALQDAAPQLDGRVLQAALQALHCAERDTPNKANRLAVIDYSRPSLERRMWVFDLSQRSLLQREFVAHGRESGELFAERFSNLPGSHQSFVVPRVIVADMATHCAWMGWKQGSMTRHVPGHW
nr:murein L,D-transpeptidase catalytic domain family protein [Pseudomonas oleovorans]